MRGSLSHEYDELGHRIRTTLPDGRALDWLHYGSGHLHQIGLTEAGSGTRTVITDIERDALHRETQRSQGALHSRYDYDPAGRLVRHRAAIGSSSATPIAAVRLERAYAYDALGQLVVRADTLRGSQEFRYDPVGRILAALPGQGSHAPRELFAFDPAGNLLDASEAQMQRAQAGQATPQGLGVVADNRLRFYQDLHFEYDIHGNVTKRTRGNRKAGHHETTELRWNADHQLVEATSHRNGVTQATRYAYDALGRRVAKADAFGATRYLWDGDLMVHSQRGGKASLFIYEPGSFVPLATVQGTQQPGGSRIYWYQCDQIGAPLELTDAQGHIAWAADYKVWGEATLRSLPSQATGTDGMAGPRRQGHGPDAISPMRSAAPRLIEQPFRFQGQQFDEETGLHYNRFRYYDPGVGRFASQDPIGLNGGFNHFTYAPNPIDWSDPWGLTGAKGTISGNKIPNKSQTGFSTGEGGKGIHNPAVQEAYDTVPLDQRTLGYHGECAEADALSNAANAAGITTLEKLKEMVEGAVSAVWRNDKKIKPMPACPSCAYVQKQLGIKDLCNKK